MTNIPACPYCYHYNSYCDHTAPNGAMVFTCKSCGKSFLNQTEGGMIKKTIKELRENLAYLTWIGTLIFLLSSDYTVAANIFLLVSILIFILRSFLNSMTFLEWKWSVIDDKRKLIFPVWIGVVSVCLGIPAYFDYIDHTILYAALWTGACIAAMTRWKNILEAPFLCLWYFICYFVITALVSFVLLVVFQLFCGSFGKVCVRL